MALQICARNIRKTNRLYKPIRQSRFRRATIGGRIPYTQSGRWFRLEPAPALCISFVPRKRILQGEGPFFPGTDLDDILHIIDEYFAIPDLAGVEDTFHRVDE